MTVSNSDIPSQKNTSDPALPLLLRESVFVESTPPHKLHLRRFRTGVGGIPVFMVHGSVENGKIFYSNSDKGLAPYLARHGYDVFVADLRGRGQSSPPIREGGKAAEFGLKEIIEVDFPLMIQTIQKLTAFPENSMQPRPMHWVSHSWGGVNLLAFLARFSKENRGQATMNSPGHPAPEASVPIFKEAQIQPPISLIFFATKRRITVSNPKKWFMVDLMWWKLGRLLVKKYGYLPAVQYKLGGDDESDRSHLETHRWVLEKPWLDWYDGFDYSAALLSMKLPPVLNLSGINDDILGNPRDIKLLAEESGQHPFEHWLLGKNKGHLADYDHITVLTHPKAELDHFPMLLKWMHKTEKAES